MKLTKEEKSLILLGLYLYQRDHEICSDVRKSILVLETKIYKSENILMK